MRNKEIAEKLVEKHVREHVYRRLSAGGHSESEKVLLIFFFIFNSLEKKIVINGKIEKDILLQEYIVTEDYTDEQREISLSKDDVIEILDISKPEKWLVRTKSKTLNQVCKMCDLLLNQCYSRHRT